MTRDQGTMLEGLCWLLTGIGIMFAIVKFAITAQN